jgi:hypothetical protein
MTLPPVILAVDEDPTNSPILTNSLRYSGSVHTLDVLAFDGHDWNRADSGSGGIAIRTHRAGSKIVKFQIRRFACLYQLRNSGNCAPVSGGHFSSTVPPSWVNDLRAGTPVAPVQNSDIRRKLEGEEDSNGRAGGP